MSIINILQQNITDSYKEKKSLVRDILLSTATSYQDLLGFKENFKSMSNDDLKEFHVVLTRNIEETKKTLNSFTDLSKMKSHPAYKSIIDKLHDLQVYENWKVDLNILSDMSDLYSIKIGSVLSDFSYSLLTPLDIKLYLDRYVVGQDRAKRAYASTLYNHLLRNKMIKDGIFPDLLPNNNLCVFGDTGTGKTYMSKLIADLGNLPFTSTNVSSLSSTGYHGEDLTSVFTNLLQKTNEEAVAEKGIILIDEFDKLAVRPGAHPDLQIKTTGLQQELLNLLESNTINVQANHDRYSNRIEFSTKNICFILAGSFVGLNEIAQKRFGINKIGFNQQEIQKPKEIYYSAQDLTSFGILPELAGRISRYAQLTKLSNDDIFQILAKSKNSAMTKFMEYFRVHNINISFSDKALKHMSKIIASKELGARYINPVMNIILEEYIFDAPILSGSSIEIREDEVIEKLKNNF